MISSTKLHFELEDTFFIVRRSLWRNTWSLINPISDLKNYFVIFENHWKNEYSFRPLSTVLKFYKSLLFKLLHSSLSEKFLGLECISMLKYPIPFSIAQNTSQTENTPITDTSTTKSKKLPTFALRLNSQQATYDYVQPMRKNYLLLLQRHK